MKLRSKLLPLVVAGIAFATLWPSGEARYRLVLCLFCDIRSVADFIANLILFAPLGIALAIQRRAWSWAFAAGALLSAAIETTQYFFVSGRHASVTDVLANAAGVVIGCVLIRSQPWQLARAWRWRAALGAAVMLNALVVGSLFLLTQSLSRPTYFLHWTAHYEGHDYYQGKVLSTRVGPWEWTDPRPMDPGDTVRAALARYPIELRFTAGLPTSRLAPIVSIHDRDSREVLQLGAEGEDLIFRYWALADVLLLDHADLRIEGMFAGLQPDDTVDLSWAFSSAGYCLRWNGRQNCGRGFTVADTWTLLISPDWSNQRSRLAGVFWLVLVFFPLGFVTASWRLIGVIALFSVPALILGPLLAGFAVTPWYQIVTAVAGMILGHFVAGRFGHRRATSTSNTMRIPDQHLHDEKAPKPWLNLAAASPRR